MDKPVLTARDPALFDPLLAARVEEDEPIDLLAYWRVVYKNLWGILGLVIATGLGAMFYAYSLQPVYSASVQVMVNVDNAKLSPVTPNDAIGVYFRSMTFYDTQIHLLRSKNMAEQVMERLKLWEHPAFDPSVQKRAIDRFDLGIEWRQWFPWLAPSGEEIQPVSEEQLKGRIVGQLRSGISASRLKDTDILEISFVSWNPQLASDIVNGYAEVFIEQGLESRLEMVRRAGSWLTAKIEGLREKVKESELKLQQFREQHGLVGGDLDLREKQLESFEGRLADARLKVAEQESLLRQMGNLETMSATELAVNPLVARNPQIQELKLQRGAAEAKVTELGQRYGPQHPKMMAAQAEVKRLDESLKREIARTMAGVRQEASAARSLVAQLEKDQEAREQDVRDQSRQGFALRVLERDVETNRQLYDLFLTRFKETDLGTDVESTNARIIDAADPPGTPIAPQPRQIILKAVAAALVLGILLAFLLDRLDTTIKDADEAEARFKMPVLGVLPFLEEKRAKGVPPERIFQDEPQSVFAEAIRGVRTGVILSGLDERHKVVLVTSTVPGEGKSTVAVNLALALGQLEKVLLIGGDMRRGSIGEHFGLSRGAPGLSDLVAKTDRAGNCIHHLERARIDVLPAGMIPPNPLELLSSRRFAHAISRLSEVYDRIVIDSAPTQAVSDAVILSSLANAVVYVVKADATPYPLVQDGIKKLRQVDAPLIGTVLNFQDLRKSPKYGRYGRYGKYGRHYAYYYQARDEVKPAKA